MSRIRNPSSIAKGSEWTWKALGSRSQSYGAGVGTHWASITLVFICETCSITKAPRTARCAKDLTSLRVVLAERAKATIGNRSGTNVGRISTNGAGLAGFTVGLSQVFIVGARKAFGTLVHGINALQGRIGSPRTPGAMGGRISTGLGIAVFSFAAQGTGWLAELIVICANGTVCTFID